MSAIDPDLDFIRVDEEAFSPARKSRWITQSWNVRQMLCGADGCGLERCRFLVLFMGDSAHTAEGNVCHGDVINHKTETAMCMPNLAWSPPSG